METEAETPESISITKLKEEKDLNCRQLDATINEASLSEFQKNEDQYFSPPNTVENSIQPEVATVEEICRTSDDCKDKEKPILVKNEQDKVMQLENDAVEAKHRIPESTEIDALSKQNSTATSLNNARTEYKEVVEPSELPVEGNNVKDYMVEKLPSLPITSTLVDLSVQEGKLGGGEGEVMDERKQMTENLFNDEKNLMEKVEKDDCLVENSDEQMSEAICASQSIKKEKAISGSHKDDIEDKSSGGDPLIEPGVGQTIGATPDHNHEASLVPALIKESLANDDRSEEATKKPEVSIDKNMEANLHEEGLGKEQDTSSNLLIMEKDPESIIQAEEIENEKKEGDENQQASLKDTCISTDTTSPGIQNGEADNLEDEESTSNKFEIPSFTTTTEEANSQTAKPEESGILEYASSFTLEAKKDAEKLKEEVCKRHEIANSNEYIGKQIIQEEEAINDQSAVSSGEEIIKCTQEDEEEKHDVEVSEGLQMAETSQDSEGRIMEAEDVEEHSTGKQEDVEEMTMETDTNILSKEIHQKTATEDDGTIQHDSKISDGEGTVKDNSREDEKKAKDPVEVFEGLETAGASEDSEKPIVKDGVFTNLSTEFIGEQTIKESEVKETNSTDSTQRPSTSIATEASEDIHKERNEKLVGPSLLVSEDHIEGKSVEKAEITSDKLETESVTLVTEKTSLHQAEQEDVKLIGHSSFPSEKMSTGTTDFQALDVEEVKLDHSKLDEVNESILTTENPDANKVEDDIKYDVIERACVAESESEHHGIERTTEMEITASETPKDEEKDKLFECSTSASTQPELEIAEAQENIKDETLMEEKIQGEKRETPMAVQEKEENFTLKEEICMFEETSKIEPEDIGKETAFEELQKQEPAEYKDAHKSHKTVEETCIENFEQETAGELENTSCFETQEKSLDRNKSDKETNDEYAREDEDKNEIDISEIVETRDEEVQEQSSEKGGSEVEAKEICVNVVFERVDTAASGSVAAKDTSDNVEGAVENLQGFVEEKEGAETSGIDSARETGPKIEVEDLTNVEVLQQNIKQVDSCEKIQSTEIEIPYKHHDESSASADKSREEIEGENDQEEAHQVIEASKVSGSEAATSEHEASGFIQTSKIECVKLEKTGDLNLKEEQDYTDAKEVTTNQEEILGKDLYISETEGVNTEERITDKDNVAKDIITVSLADEIAGQSCQEDETEQQQIVEPEPELKDEDLLHRTSDADETTTNGTRDKEVYEGCKTGDSGESKEKQLKDEDCTVKNVSAVSIAEETVDESSQAESPKEVLEVLETANADEHIEKQIIKEDGAANDQHTVAVREETVKESSQKVGEVEVAEKPEIECEASSIIHLSEGLQEGGPSEDTSEQMIEENDDGNDNSTVYAAKEEHKDGINISDIPNGEETITENPHKEEETNKQGEVKESNLILEELSFEATDSAAKTRTVTLEDEEDTNKNSAAITVIEVSEEEQHIDNSEKLNETSSLLSEVSKEQVKEEILEQPEKTNNKLQTSFIMMETENISFLESELNTTDLVNSTDLPSAEMSPSCPPNVEASATTLQALDVEDIKLEETSTITMETENGSLHESELEPTNLVDATDIPSGRVSPGYPANVEASATTLQALDVEDMKLKETSFVTMETEKISLYESELETPNLVDATDIPSGGMSPGYPANVEASATTLQALDVEDMKLEETSFVTVKTEKISLHESEQETMNLVDTTNILSGEMSPGCPASATTLQTLDVEDIKLRETSSLAMETQKISLHESELETTSVDSTDLPSEEMNPDCPANVEASETALQALDVEDMKLEETSSITRVSLHESELERTNLVDSTDPPSGEMSPICPGNVEASVTTLQALDVEAMKLKETSNINDNTNEEILAAEKTNAAEAVEGMEYNIMLEEDSGTVPVDDEQGAEAEITAKICSDDEKEETLQESSTPKPRELDSTEAQEKITDQISVENETQDEKLEIPSIAQQEEEMPMQQEEEASKVEEDTKMGSEGREDEYVNELQNREGETKDKYLELSPGKQILEIFFVKPTQFSEYRKTEGSEPESEKGKSEGEKNFDELAEEQSTGACAYEEKDILDEGRSENIKVKDEVVEDQSHERNGVSNATMKETIIENPKAVDPTKKLTDTSESDAENQNHATLIETKKTETEEEGNIISISVEDQIVGKNFQEEDKEHENLEETGHKLENEDQSGKINYVNETEVPHEDERPEESDKIQKQVMEEEVASQELYTASVNDEAVKEVKAAEVVSIKQNFQVIDSSEKTETEGTMDEKDWNKSNVFPITTESDEELPKKEGSDMLETPSVIVATEERSVEEVEPDAEKNVVVSSIGFEEKSLQTVETTETSEKDDSVNLEERFESVSHLPTFEDENRNQGNLPGEKLGRDKVEEGIKDELVIASVAAPQSEGPMEHANPESDTAVVGSLTVTAEEPKQKGQQSSQLEYGEQKLEIPATEMIKDNPMIEDVSQNMENTEIETTSDQNVEANKSEARELGVSAAVEGRKDEVPIENETQDMKKVEVPSVPKPIEGKFPHKEEECKELKATETGSEYIEKEMQLAEHMKEENLEITPEFIFNKNDSESTDAVSFLEKETKKTEELTETTEDSEKDTLKVDKAMETRLREDEPQSHPYTKSIDGVFQEPETVGASAYPGTDVLENRDISENENLEEENSEAISLVEKIGTLDSKNTPKNEEDSHNTNAVAEETLAGEADEECGDATNVELEKLTGDLESVTEAQIHDMLNETKMSQNSEDGAVVKDPDTVSVGDEIIQEDKMADENVSKALPKFETAENHIEKTSEANKSLGNEFAIEEVNVEKKIEEEEVANQEVVFEGSAQKPDLKFVGEETVKDSHQAGQRGEKFGDGVNPSYPTAEGTGEHIKDEVPREDERPEESDKIQKQIMEEEVASQELYTASVNDEAVKEVKAADVVSIKQNFHVRDSSEKTEMEGAMEEKDWNKSNVFPITTESGEELPKKEGSDMLETPSVIVATEERSVEEVEPDAEKNVVVSSIGFEEKSLQTVETTETSEKDDSVNLEERFESVSQLPTFEDENRNQENLPGEKLDRDKVEEGIKEDLVIASVAAPQSEGPMEHANPESDTVAVGSLTVTAEEPKQKGQQSSQLEYGEQKLEIPATEMIKDNPMIEDVSQNMENTEIETTSDQKVEANKSEARELGVSAAVEERKDEVPIENETQDMKKVEVPSVPKPIEGKFPHKEEECKELKATETGSEYIEKEMQHAEHMKEENLEITPEFIFNKNDSESTDAVSFLEKETKKTEELTETTEDSEKDTLKVDKTMETGLREDEPQSHSYKKSIDGLFQEPGTVGASAYPGTDVLENRDISENENPEEENSEAISLVEKIGTLESKNTPKNEEDSHNINAVAEETLAEEADGECGDATNVELEKLTGDLESVTEAQIHDMLNETKTSQNSEDGAVVKDPDTVSVGDEIIQEDKMADENVNVEKKIEEEEVANQEVVFEGSAQKPDLKFVGEETVKDSHQAGQKGEKFGDVVNPSYPTAERTGEHIKDEAPVEEILQKETEQTLNEAINQDVVCEDENTNIQIPGQGEPKVFLNDERETAERSITASLDELDKTSNMVLQEQSQVKTDFKSETQVNGNEPKESTKVEDAANLNENIREMSHIQQLRKEVLVKEGATELASVAEIEKSTNTTVEEQTPQEVNSTENTEEENSTGSANNAPMPKDPIEKLFGKAKAEDQKPEQALENDSEVKGVNSTKGEISTGSTAISPMPMEPIEKTFGKAEAEDQKPEQTSEIESEGKRVNSTESTKEEISSCSTDISPGPMDPTEKTFEKGQVEDQKPEQSSEIESEVKEVECGIEESTDKPKPSDLDKLSLSDHLQKSIKETLETVGQSGDETESKVNKEEVENKVAPNIQVEEEKTDKHDQDEEEDEHKKSDSGSDAPVMVEASRDVEVKPAHKKSHNILSGMGSKVKHSIAKVKKAITGKSSHHKQSSSPKQESESTITVKATADPNL